LARDQCYFHFAQLQQQKQQSAHTDRQTDINGLWCSTVIILLYIVIDHHVDKVQCA